MDTANVFVIILVQGTENQVFKNENIKLYGDKKILKFIMNDDLLAQHVPCKE